MNTELGNSDHPDLQEHTILIIDDNLTNLMVMSDYLGSCGLAVLIARDGENGLEKARYALPDLILLDILMPGIDGFETCRRLKADEATKDIPVIFMTALTDAESKVTGFEVGGVDYIAKPFQHKEIIARVTTHLRLRDLTLELQATNESLERQVEERTAELAQTNRELRAEIAERWRAEEALRRYTERLELLFEIEQDILAARSLEETVQSAISRLRKLVLCPRASITFFDFETNEFVFSTINTNQASEIAVGHRENFELYQSAIAQLRQGRLVRWQLSELNAPITNILRAEGLSVAISIPLIIQNELIGSLNLSGDSLSLTEEQEELLRQIADLLAIATQQARLRRQIQRHTAELERRVADRTRELAALYDVTALATVDMGLEKTLSFALEQVLGAMQSKTGLIHLLDEMDQTLRLLVYRGFPSDIAAHLDFRPGETSLQTWILTHKEPLVIPNITADPRAKQLDHSDPLAYVGVPIQAREQMFGVLSIFRDSQQRLFNMDEITLLTAIADHIGVVVESARLRQRAEKAAVLEERERLARELHDSVTQSLYSLTLFAEWTHRLCEAGELDAAKERLSRIGETAHQALKEMRLLLYELRPTLLEQDGLVGALQRRLEAVEKRAGIEVSLQAEPLSLARLPAALEEGLYRIAQEALNNALKHAAAGLVQLQIHMDDNRITMSITDNGVGFDPAAASSQGGLGLVIMQERAAHLGGVLTIETEPGAGTTVKITVEVNQ